MISKDKQYITKYDVTDDHEFINRNCSKCKLTTLWRENISQLGGLRSDMVQKNIYLAKEIINIYDLILSTVKQA